MTRSHCGALASLTHRAPPPCLSSAEWSILVLCIPIFFLWGWFWISQLREVSNLLFEPTLQPFLPSSCLFLASFLSDTIFHHSPSCRPFPSKPASASWVQELQAALALCVVCTAWIITEGSVSVHVRHATKRATSQASPFFSRERWGGSQWRTCGGLNVTFESWFSSHYRLLAARLARQALTEPSCSPSLHLWREPRIHDLHAPFTDVLYASANVLKRLMQPGD